jgi:hypothetical protein
VKQISPQKPTKAQLEHAQRFKNRVAQRLELLKARKQGSEAQGETEPTQEELEHAKRFKDRVAQRLRLLEAREQQSQSQVKTALTKPVTRYVN